MKQLWMPPRIALNQFTLGCLVAGVAVTGCGGHNTQKAPPLWPNVRVLSVTGIHEGRCGTKRIAEVSQILRTLSSRDIEWGRVCHCMSLSLPQRVAEMRFDEKNSSARVNAIAIDLDRAIQAPNWAGRLRSPAKQVIFSAGDRDAPRYNAIIWLGGWPLPSSPNVPRFSGLGMNDDPFDLHDREC